MEIVLMTATRFRILQGTAIILLLFIGGAYGVGSMQLKDGHPVLGWLVPAGTLMALALLAAHLKPPTK